MLVMGAEEFRQLRVVSGRSVTSMAQTLHVSPTTVRRWEQGGFNRRSFKRVIYRILTALSAEGRHALLDKLQARHNQEQEAEHKKGNG